VLSKGVKFGVKFNKQGFGAWCCVWCCGSVLGAKQTSKGLAWCRVLSKDKVRVLSKQTKQG
jgi:hypothetical protein